MAVRPSSCARRPPRSRAHGSHHAGDGRRRGDAANHGQHAVRDPHRHRERRREFDVVPSRRWATARWMPSIRPCSGPPIRYRAPHALLAKIETVGRMLDQQAPGPASSSGTSTRGGRLIAGERLIAIGASAGGPAALATVLARPAEGFSGGDRRHAARRRAVCRRDGDVAWSADRADREGRGRRRSPGARHGAAGGTNNHLVFKGADRVGYDANRRDYVYRPSVDVFFQSVSQHWPGEAIGVLLTGHGPRRRGRPASAQRTRGITPSRRTRRAASCTACPRRPRSSRPRSTSFRWIASRHS